jgi:transketolase
MSASFGPRRGIIMDAPAPAPAAAGDQGLRALERLDLAYRSLCAMLYNYVPTSGHPGGSLSSGRIVEALGFGGADYDLAAPEREEADVISYAAGHKAMGLYALWALRDEVARIGAPDLLPRDAAQRLRLEDLLGFRRNPSARTALQRSLGTRFLDGHPTPATPFVRLSTGASGVGLAASIGLAIGAWDRYGASAPVVHVLEGEGGMTPGRVAEALAAAGTMSLPNVVLHVDWNQASIDSERVCRDGDAPGDYVQWEPAELAYLHDWNVVRVERGMSFPDIQAAQRAAAGIANGQPTAIVYRTVKGWQYGVQGRASHGAGHKLCSDGFHQALAPFLDGAALPRCDAANRRCAGGKKPQVMEECFWEALGVVRRSLEADQETVQALAARLREARSRLDGRRRAPRAGAPRVQAIPELARAGVKAVPPYLRCAPGAVTTLRGELGRSLAAYNKASGGALFVASADLMASTSLSQVAAGFAEGWFNARGNPGSRLLATGGICEDAMSGILSGISSFGQAIGVGSSYGAFLAPLGHVAARLHAIGSQAREARTGRGAEPLVLVCGHAGLKTGEDGPTHADPQALQLLQGNFPPGALVTLTPWDPAEVWTLLSAALARRPSVVAVFVTRPQETVPDRAALGLAPVEAAAAGVYRLRAAEGRKPDGVVVLQGSEAAFAFVRETLPLLARAGIDLEAYYVASAELFDALPPARRLIAFPEEAARSAMGITGFTLPTMDRWILSARGREATLHPFRSGRFLGSGQAEDVVREAGLDGRGQLKAIKAFLARRGAPRAAGRR